MIDGIDNDETDMWMIAMASTPSCRVRYLLNRDSTPLSDPLSEGCELNDEAGLHHRSWLVNDPGSQVAVACEWFHPGQDPIPEGCREPLLCRECRGPWHGDGWSHCRESIDNVESQFGGGVVGLAVLRRMSKS